MGIVLIIGWIVLAGVFALAELALVAARRPLLRERSGRGDRRAGLALALCDRLEHVVPALRLGALFALVQAGMTAGLWLDRGGEGASGGSAGWLVAWLLVAGAISLAGIVLTELWPRRFVQFQPERLAAQLSGPVRAFSAIVRPAVAAAGWAARLLMPPQKPPLEGRPRLTRDALIEILEDLDEEGGLDPRDLELFRRVLRFCDRRARTMMTPRSEVVWIDVADSPDEIRRKVVSSPHSRFPVCDQSLDNLLGIVQVKDLLAQRSEGPMYRIKGFLTLPAFILEWTRGTQILETLRQSSTHIAAVLDEYGSVVGILTLNDILENVLGNLPEGQGEPEDPLKLRPDGSRLIDGRLPIDEFQELYGLASLPEGNYHTLAGLVVTLLGRIPRPHETLELQGLQLEVVEMSANRVVRVLVSMRNGQPAANDAAGS